jgi:outer membrane immunogenic protein
VAFLDADFSYSDESVDNGFRSGTASDTLVGWVAGGGIEYALSHNWSVEAEYLYFDFASSTVHTFLENTPPFDFKNDLSVTTVKASLNYKFGGDYEPLK